MAFKYFFLVCLSYYLIISNGVQAYDVIKGTVDTVAGGRMYYQISGNGNEVLVIIDGSYGCVVADNFRKFYDAIDLEKTFKIVQVDLPGFGDSKNGDPVRTYKDIEGYEKGGFFQRDADAVIQTLQELKIQKYSVLGWGWGGTVALYVTARAPNNVHKCIEWNAKPYAFDDFVKEEKDKRKIAEEWDKELRVILLKSYTDEYLNKVSNSQLEGWQLLCDVKSKPSEEALKSIIRPVLILSATGNKFAKSNQYEQMKKDIKPEYFHSIIFEISKHALHKLDEFAVVVKKFLHEDNYPNENPLMVKCIKPEKK